MLVNVGATVLSFERRRAISKLYRSHGTVVLRRAYRITGSHDEARDVLQELFRRLVEEPESLDGARNQVAWLYGATTHLCLNRIRNRKNREQLLQNRAPPKHVLEPSAETIALVRQALASLPGELASAFVYYYLDQMTHAEIASIMGCSRRHVGDLLERARTMLKQLDERSPDD